MKSYDDLKPTEREKLRTYLQARKIALDDRNRGVNLGFALLFFTVIISVLVAIVGFQIINTSVLMEGVYGVNDTSTVRMFDAGVTLMEILPMIIFAGLIGFILIWFVSEYMFERYKKVDYLVFGYTSFEEALEIKKSDVNDLEKTYKKVKKDGNSR